MLLWSPAYYISIQFIVTFAGEETLYAYFWRLINMINMQYATYL